MTLHPDNPDRMLRDALDRTAERSNHPPPPEGFADWIDWCLHVSPHTRRVWNEDIEKARSELARLRRIEKAAKACDRIYSGSFQGLPLFCNFLDGEPVDAAPLFNELKAALEAKP